MSGEVKLLKISPTTGTAITLGLTADEVKEAFGI